MTRQLAIDIALTLSVLLICLSVAAVYVNSEQRRMQREAISRGYGRIISTPSGAKFQWIDKETEDGTERP